MYSARPIAFMLGIHESHHRRGRPRQYDDVIGPPHDGQPTFETGRVALRTVITNSNREKDRENPTNRNVDEPGLVASRCCVNPPMPVLAPRVWIAAQAWVPVHVMV
jgi:hypothetical protein